MQQAIADAGLEEREVSHERTGLIMGSGGPSTRNIFEAHRTVIEKGSPKRMGPFMVTRCMSSTDSACLATPFRIKGVNYSITSACSTSAHCIGSGVEQIQFGKQDIVFAGGGEELDWTLSCLFDAMGAMSSKYNDTPETASRPSTRPATASSSPAAAASSCSRSSSTRWRAARRSTPRSPATAPPPTATTWSRRRARAPSVHADRARDDRQPQVGYINTHGTSTPVGDVNEIEAIRRVFGDGHVPMISSTKSLTGHSLGATGVQEAIYCLLMLQRRLHRRLGQRDDLDPALRPGEIASSGSTTPGSTRCSPTASASAAPTPRWRSAATMGEAVGQAGLLAGRRALILGVANDHSIAWGIARAFAAQGAELAFTYQGEGFERRVIPLAESVGSKIVCRPTCRTPPRSTRSSRGSPPTGAGSTCWSTRSPTPTRPSSTAASSTPAAPTSSTRSTSPATASSTSPAARCR